MTGTNKTGLNIGSVASKIAPPPPSEKSSSKIQSSDDSSISAETKAAEKTTNISQYSAIALSKISKVPDDIQLSSREVKAANDAWGKVGASLV